MMDIILRRQGGVLCEALSVQQLCKFLGKNSSFFFMEKDFIPTGFFWYTTNMIAVSSFFTPIIWPSKSHVKTICKTVFEWSH